MHTQPRLKDLLAERLTPGWVVHINGRVVVTRTRQPYQRLDAALVPTQASRG
jgi:hypothetical protein